VFNMIDDFGSPECHTYRGQLALTDPNLEPEYPVPGGQIPSYSLPQVAKKHPSLTFERSQYAFGHLTVNTAPLFKALNEAADKLFRCY
ncbi:hypothetical protein ABTI16_20000, partial [Acinetobacter baumannii]